MRIKKISNEIDNQVLILFWQFTIKTIEELDIVSNQNLSIEMFLIRLLHLTTMKNKDKIVDDQELSKKEFLASYSYLVEEEYNLTRMKEKENG